MACIDHDDATGIPSNYPANDPNIPDSQLGPYDVPEFSI